MADCLVFFLVFVVVVSSPWFSKRDGSGGASAVHERGSGGSGGSLHPVEERRETARHPPAQRDT